MTANNKKLSKVKAVYAITIIFLVALSIYAYTQINNLIDSSGWVNHTNNVTLALQKISTAMTEAETNQRGFLLAGDTTMLHKRDSAFEALDTELRIVDSLTRDNPRQVKNLARLRVSISEKMQSMQKIAQISARVQMDSVLRSEILTGVNKMNHVRHHLNQMALAESRLLDKKETQYLKLSFITPMFIVVLFLVALLILLISFFRLNAALNEARVLQNKFEEEKNLAQTILNSSPDNIIVLDNNLRCISANHQAAEFLNSHGVKYHGRLVSEIFPDSQSLSDLKEVL